MHHSNGLHSFHVTKIRRNDFVLFLKSSNENRLMHRLSLEISRRSSIHFLLVGLSLYFCLYDLLQHNQNQWLFKVTFAFNLWNSKAFKQCNGHKRISCYWIWSNYKCVAILDTIPICSHTPWGLIYSSVGSTLPIEKMRTWQVLRKTNSLDTHSCIHWQIAWKK